MPGRQRAQAPRRRAWICRSARSTTTPRRAWCFAQLTELWTSPGGGSGGARRASAKPLARACDPAKDIAVRATCTRRPFKIDRAMLPGTAAGAHPGLSRGRGRGAGSTERLRWCGSPCPGNKGNRSGASGGCSKHERFNMRQHAGRQGARRQAQGGRPRAAGAGRRLGAACTACARARVVLDRRANGEPRLWSLHNKKLTAQKPFLCVILKLTHTKLATVSYASYYAYRTTSRRSGAGPPRNAHLCMSIILLSSTCMYVVPVFYQIH